MDQLIHILYLEDDAADMELVQATLESAGMACQITRVQTRDEFGAAVRQGGSDIILADFRLPMFDGMSALRLAREQCPDIPFIFVSGTMGEDAAIEGLTQGATDYVLKQKLSRLAPAVKRALRDAENRRERKRAEEALHESEERFRRLAENAQDLIYRYRHTPKPCFEYVNPAVNKILGYSPEEFYADPALFVKILHPDDQQLVEAAMLGEIELEPFSVLRWAHKDGSIVWTEQRHIPIFDQAGNFLVIEGIARDITERKRAEETLARERELLRTLVDNLPEEVYVKDRERRFLLVNELVVRALGAQSMDEIIGKRDEDFMPPDLAKQFADEEDELMQTGKPLVEDEHIPPHKPGPKRWYARTKLPLRDGAGNIIGLVGLGRDITERKRAEEALHESEERFRAVAESANDGIVSADSQGTIFYWNQAARVMFGYADEEILGQPLTVLMPERFQEQYRDGMRRWAARYERSRVSPVVEVLGRRKDGGEFPMELSVASWKTHEDTFFTGMVRDITERKQVENIMQARLRLLEFASSHSMGELLTATLDEIEALTGSTIGFYHFLEADQKVLSLQNWSTNTLKTMCTAAGKGSHYDIAQAGVWVDCVYERRPVIHNDYASLPHRKGMPEGHAPVIREVVVPIFRGNLIKAIIGVGNKATNYNENDIEIVSQLGDLSWDITDRKRAEEALRQSERRKTILNQIANVFLTVPDVEMYGEVLTIVLEVMEGKFGVFGFIADNGDLVMPSMTREIWSECQVPNKSIVFPSATWGDSLWGRAIREQKAFYSDGPFHTPEGHIHIDSFLTAPIVFGNKTIGLLSVANRARGYTEEDKDLLESITRYISPILNARLQRDRQEQERKQAEEALHQANETLRATLEAAPVAIFDLDTEGRVKSLWNAAAEQMLGWRRDEVLGHFLPSVPEESPDEFARFREWIRSGKSIVGNDVVRRRKDGSLIDYSIYAAPEYDDDGKVIGNIAVLVDITERKRAEEQRRLQTTALEAAANAIVITDRGGNIQWANPAFTALTGYTVEDALGQNPRFLKSAQHDPAFYHKLWETILAGQVWHDLIVNKRKDGSLYTEEMTITPVRATGSEITHFIAIKQDVTQRQQAEAEILRHVQRLMTLQEIGRAITSTLDLDHVLVTLLERVRQVTEAEAGSVALIEAATGDLVFRQAAGEAGQVVIGLRLKPGQGIAGWAADHRQIVMAPDALSDPRFYGDISSGAGFVTRDLVAAPLIARDTVIGVIELLNKREGTFSQSDLWLIESVAAQAAVAIENARLFEETRRRLDEMAVVSYVAMVGAAGQPFDETVARATSSLNQLWPGAKVGFLFVDEADQTLRPHPSYFGVLPEIIADLRVPLNQGLTGWAVRERQPIRVGDVTSDPHYIAGAPDTRSEMAAPLVVGDGSAAGPTSVIGVVNVESPLPDVFSGEDLRLLATLASQLATIFEKARLDAELALHAAMLERRVEGRTAEIHRQQARTQAILDALGEGVVVTDSRGTIQYLNPAAQALTGYGADEVIGQNPRLWNSGRVPLQVYQEMWNTILSGRTWRGEIVNRRKDGALYDVAITIAPVLGETSGGPPAGLVGIQRDITLRKQAEEEIRKVLAQEKELSELKSRFISMASHEFRTPLSTILSSSELLEHYGSQWLEGKGLVNLRRIQAAVHHMAQLLNDVLVLGRADAGKLEFNPAPMDLVQFCRELTEEIQLGVGRQHTLLFASQGECVGACLDEKLLRQILSNLLSNACKYSPEGSDVHFDLECREGQAIFCVRDQGIGIPPEDQARLFETFHRARNVNNIPGTGLGMAIVKKSVDLHGGTINVASQVGVGTTFTVTLPLRVTGEA